MPALPGDEPLRALDGLGERDQAVPVLDDDDEATLHERIKVVERQLLVDVLDALATRGVTWTGRKATIG